MALIFHEEKKKMADKLINTSEDISNLTVTEMEIALMIKSGLSITEIAHHACITIATVKMHKKNIRNKLGIRNVKISLECYLISNFS